MPSLPAPENAALKRVLDLAPPALYPNESKSRFLALAERMVDATKPRDALEEILVRDVIDLTWEIQRLREAKASVVVIAMTKSLEQVLNEIGYGGALDRKVLSDVWVGGKGPSRDAVHRALYEANLSVNELPAQALEIKLDTIERFERMLASAEARRITALREIDRHREALGAAARRAIEEAEDGDFTEVETDTA